MVQKHLMIAIDWYGPYWDLDEARNLSRYDYAHGLYMGIGKCAYERSVKLQYIGIGSQVHKRLTERHEKLSLITRDRALWLGEIATAEPAGGKMKATKATLNYAEWLHARFLQLPLNEKKTKTLPSRSVTVLNRWFHTGDDRKRARRPHAEWPDLIDFPDFELPARAVWFGRRQKQFHPPEYLQPD